MNPVDIKALAYGLALCT